MDGRTPENPLARALARRARTARVAGAFERLAHTASVATHKIHLQVANFLRTRCARVAILPKPVLTP